MIFLLIYLSAKLIMKDSVNKLIIQRVILLVVRNI